MGYDIKFVPFRVVSNWLTETGKELKEMYINDYLKFPADGYTSLSYNFGIFSDFWDAYDNFGKTSKEFAESLRKASRELTNRNISDKIPSGICEKTGEPFDTCTSDIRVFHNNIMRLIEVCEDNPRCVVFADTDHDMHISREDLDYDEDNENDDDETDEEKESFHVYFCHPLKGNMIVDRFEKACEVSMILKKSGDVRWKSWEDLAWKLPGAPVISH